MKKILSAFFLAGIVHLSVFGQQNFVGEYELIGEVIDSELDAGYGEDTTRMTIQITNGLYRIDFFWPDDADTEEDTSSVYAPLINPLSPEDGHRVVFWLEGDQYVLESYVSGYLIMYYPPDEDDLTPEIFFLFRKVADIYADGD